MKDWKFVLFWFAFLTTIELGFYGRYYLFFYEPDVPFRLVKAWHSSTSGANWNDEEYGSGTTQSNILGTSTIDGMSLLRMSILIGKDQCSLGTNRSISTKANP